MCASVKLKMSCTIQVYTYIFIWYVRIYDINIFVGTTVQEPGDVVYLPDVTTLPIELTCDVSPAAAWLINNRTYLLNQLMTAPGHNVDGQNILINNPMNNSEYSCSDGTNNGGLYRIFIAGECDIKFCLCVYTYIYTVYTVFTWATCAWWFSNWTDSYMPIVHIYHTV